MPDTSKTIATSITPPGRGGIAVIILAGRQAQQMLSAVFRPLKSHKNRPDRALQLGNIVDGQRVIDQAIICRCQQHVEINIHGGPVAAAAVLQLLARRGAQIRPQDGRTPTGLEPAHPRWSNPAVGTEMLEALPHARSELVVAAISNQWSAGLSRLARRIVTGGEGSDQVAAALRRAADGLTRQVKLLTPPQVVLAGPPNVGKSTLANALVGRQISIVHDKPGTTRDWVRELALFDGAPVFLTDTAGLWEKADGVDAEAVARARKCANDADLVLLVSAATPVERPDWLVERNVVHVAAKCDLHDARGPAEVTVSALTGRGLGELKLAVLAGLGLADLDAAAPMAFTQRQADLLNEAAEAFERGGTEGAKGPLLALLEGQASGLGRL